jgi:hypothetical protein
MLLTHGFFRAPVVTREFLDVLVRYLKDIPPERIGITLNHGADQRLERPCDADLAINRILQIKHCRRVSVLWRNRDHFRSH